MLNTVMWPLTSIKLNYIHEPILTYNYIPQSYYHQGRKILEIYFYITCMAKYISFKSWFFKEIPIKEADSHLDCSERIKEGEYVKDKM